LQAIVAPSDAIEITLTGALFDGASFEGSDAIRVIEKGKDHVDQDDPASVEY